MKTNRFLIAALSLSLLSSSCSKQLDTLPTDQVGEEQAMSSIANISAALNGTYRALYMQYSGQTEDGLCGLMIFNDFMGEDIVHTATGTTYYRNAHRWVDHRNEASDYVLFAYRMPYKVIANANQILKYIDKVPDGTDVQKAMTKAEALGLRAWGHFNLVQYFGKRYDVATKPNTQLGVPILTEPSTEPKPRATVEEVYAQVVKDLDEAIVLATGKAGSAFKTHLNLASLKGLRARVALNMQDYTKAAQLAAEARAAFPLMSQEDYQKGFTSMLNTEWMWCANQLADQLPSFGGFYAYMSANFNSAHTRPNPKKINTRLYNFLSATDVRKKLWWSGTTADAASFPGVIIAATGLPDATQRKAAYQHRKFVVSNPALIAGDIPFMRAAEMYLIEAEAHARNGQTALAQDALFNLVKTRDLVAVKSTRTGAALIEEIMNHRRVELWGEGFRFFDLKRTDSPLDRTNTGATTTLANVLTVAAGTNDWQFKIPRRELEANPLMVQNP